MLDAGESIIRRMQAQPRRTQAESSGIIRARRSHCTGLTMFAKPARAFPTVIAIISILSACTARIVAVPPADPPSAVPTPAITASPTLIFTPTPTPIPDQIVDAHGIEMLLVPAGEFIMGSDAGFPDEEPVHKVYLDTFYVDKFETTNREYKACVDAGACHLPVRLDCCTDTQLVLWPSYFGDPDFDNYPVTYLDWYDARDYCTWRGVRLATEAEWEKAARGADGRIYPWGNDPPSPGLLNFAWLPREFEQRALPGTAPVGSYPAGASPYGVMDLLGNVYEWVADIYDPNYYSVSPYHNPTGPAEGKYRIARGGSFYNTAFRNRASNRNNAFLPADLAHFDAGVRCAMSLSTP